VAAVVRLRARLALLRKMGRGSTGQSLPERGMPGGEAQETTPAHQTGAIGQNSVPSPYAKLAQRIPSALGATAQLAVQPVVAESRQLEVPRRPQLAAQVSPSASALTLRATKRNQAPISRT
jgi:hypothetical protein